MTIEQTAPPLLVTVVNQGAAPQNYRFTKSFRIGRTGDCDVCVKSEFVSRNHVQVDVENGYWVARDLGSSNGIFSGGVRVPQVSVANPASFRLGVEGPTVSLELEPLP